MYIATAQKAPRAFGAVYEAGELYRRLPFRSPVYYANQAMISQMEEYLGANHFDVVIMPHLFPAEIMTNMKRRGMDIPGTMFLATDYCCIPFTEETDCDAYVVPGEELADEFAGRGIPREKIYPLGIPVDRSFRAGRRRSVPVLSGVHCQFGKRYILIAGGSIGAGKIDKLIGLLLERAEREALRRRPASL